MLKGIQTVRDAKKAVDAGVDGIIVSNHGGRQVDGCVPSLDCLPPVRIDPAPLSMHVRLLDILVSLRSWPR